MCFYFFRYCTQQNRMPLFHSDHSIIPLLQGQQHYLLTSINSLVGSTHFQSTTPDHINCNAGNFWVIDSGESLGQHHHAEAQLFASESEGCFESLKFFQAIHISMKSKRISWLIFDPEFVCCICSSYSQPLLTLDVPSHIFIKKSSTPQAMHAESNWLVVTSSTYGSKSNIINRFSSQLTKSNSLIVTRYICTMSIQYISTSGSMLVPAEILPVFSLPVVVSNSISPGTFQPPFALKHTTTSNSEHDPPSNELFLWWLDWTGDACPHIPK